MNLILSTEETLTYQSFPRAVLKWGSRDGHVNRADEIIWVVYVERIFQIRVWKPNAQEELVIEKEWAIESEDFTRISVIDVWYEVFNAEINFEIDWKV